MTVFDTILAAATVLLLLTGVVLVGWDWWRMITGKTTFSGWIKEHVSSELAIYLGLLSGFIVGSWLGFVAGHLFWPIVGK